ncbi:MAG: NAD(P)/FAD-dependent oxidoreductase [Candidatus Binatia bacterium]
MRIAVVGSGIAGLTAAWHLSRHHEVTVFEKNDYAGGHSHTVAVEDDGRELGLDTGFIVYNEETYPGFSRMLAELGVATQESEMSFGMSCRRCSIEYSGRGLRGLFGDPRLLFRPSHYRMVLEIFRFNREGAAALDDASLADRTLGELLEDRRYSAAFVRHYVVPMGAAIWSSKTGAFRDFPLHYFLGFFRNHGLLSVAGQPVWRTVRGGSRRYVEALTRSFADRMRLGCAVRRIRRLPHGVEVVAGGSTSFFDRVVIAAHSGEALALLADPGREEAEALSAIGWQRNVATLHTDSRRLPRRRAARASWNVHVEDCADGEAPLSMTYFLNRLQRFTSSSDYCVTLNDDGAIDPRRVLRRIEYEHPIYTLSSLEARRRLLQLGGERHTYYCGAWLGYGFHEDGFRSALHAVAALEERRVAA